MTHNNFVLVLINSPDLLLISAGFDAHFDDMYHFLREDDFHWVTEQLCHASASASVSSNTNSSSSSSPLEPSSSKDIKVVSILEGGYSLGSAATTGKAGIFKSKRKDGLTIDDDRYIKFAQVRNIL